MRIPLHPWLLLAAAVAGLAGCATVPKDPEARAYYEQTNDPLEPTNRLFYRVNNALDSVILRPIALVYVNVLPDAVRTHVGDVLDNLSAPVRLGNDLLQADGHWAGQTAMRFLINSTVGVAGIFDPATGWGFPTHDTDFGVTLAVWGIPQGPFLFLPVLGPSDPRDATGFGANMAMDPFTWVGKGATVSDLGWARFGTSAVDARASVLGQLDQIKETALDPYATLRSLYRQHRQSQVETALTARQQ